MNQASSRHQAKICVRPSLTFDEGQLIGGKAAETASGAFFQPPGRECKCGTFPRQRVCLFQDVPGGAVVKAMARFHAGVLECDLSCCRLKASGCSSSSRVAPSHLRVGFQSVITLEEGEASV